MRCPVCGKSYALRHSTEEEAKEENDQIGVEQHISGICSRVCYLKECGTYIGSVDDLDKALDKYNDLFLIAEEVEDGQYEEVEEINIKRDENGFYIEGHDNDLEELSGLIENKICYYSL